MGFNTITINRSFFILAIFSLFAFGCTSGPESVVKKYLSASQWQDRLAFVRNPKMVRRLMEKEYGKDWSKVDSYNLGESHIKDDRAVIQAHVNGSPVLYVLMKENGEWKIDWPISIPYNPMTSAAYQAQRPVEHYNMRVQVKLSDYYNYEFSKAQPRYYSVSISDPEGKEMPHGYVEKATESGKGLFELLKDGETHLAILKLSYLPGSTGNIAVIQKVVSYSWQDDEPKLVDHPGRTISSVYADSDSAKLESMQNEGCKEGAKSSQAYQMCKAGYTFGASSRCACAYLLDKSKLAVFCSRVREASKESSQVCLENSVSQEEYASCMQVPYAIHTKEEFDKLYDNCKS